MSATKRIFVMAIFASSCASAAPMCTTLSTLQGYMDQQSVGCEFGDKIFYNFNYLYSAGGNTNVPASAVTVTPTVSADGFNYALTFAASGGGWTSDGSPGVGPRTSDITLTFSVAAPANRAISGTTLSMTGNIYYTTSYSPYEMVGSITGAESYSGSGGVHGSLDFLSMSTPSLNPSSATQSLAASGVFNPVMVLTVSKDIGLFSGGNYDAYTDPNYKDEKVTLTSFTESFQEIPEPGVVLTLGSGCIFLSLVGKRLAQRTGASQAAVGRGAKNKDLEAL